MKQIFLIAKREYITQVRNKTFLIMTILSPLFILAVGAVIYWMNSANQNKKQIAVIDQSQYFIKDFVSDKNMSYSFYGPGDLKAIKDSLNGSDYLNALLVIPNTQNLNEIEQKTELFTNGNLGLTSTQSIKNVLDKQIQKEKLNKIGITEEKLVQTKSRLNLQILDLKQGESEQGTEVKIILASILMYVVFMFIMIYGVKVMRSILEEKTNRVVEIIISSVKPFELMMGKILGTSLVAVTQFTIWIGLSLSITLIAPAIAKPQISGELTADTPNLIGQIDHISHLLLSLNYPIIILVFIVFFVFGYLFYSSIFAAIGSAVDSDADTQQFTFYPIFPMMIALYGSISIVQNPDGPVAFWLSMIPFTSPIAMIARIPFNVPNWQICLSLCILIISSLGMIYLAGRIYRVGILMFGKKPTIKEIFKWIRYNN